MQTSQIVLASRSEQENQLLRHKLEPVLKDHRAITFVSVHHQGLISSMEASTAVVVLNHTDFGDRQKVEVENLRASGYAGSIVVIAKNFSTLAMDYLRAEASLVIIEKPFETRDFEGIIRKILTEREVAQRIHRRFNVSQDVEISGYGNETAYSSKVCNLSVGGAYLEFMTPPPLSQGELVRVRFELTEMNRTYTMPARVVWAKRDGQKANYALGVEFIGPGDVKTKHLQM